jgi:hypothetical protein
MKRCWPSSVTSPSCSGSRLASVGMNTSGVAFTVGVTVNVVLSVPVFGHYWVRLAH